VSEEEGFRRTEDTEGAEDGGGRYLEVRYLDNWWFGEVGVDLVGNESENEVSEPSRFASPVSKASRLTQQSETLRLLCCCKPCLPVELSESITRTRARAIGRRGKKFSLLLRDLRVLRARITRAEIGGIFRDREAEGLQKSRGHPRIRRRGGKRGELGAREGVCLPTPGSSRIR
jgi:hypothetical protein